MRTWDTWLMSAQIRNILTMYRVYACVHECVLKFAAVLTPLHCGVRCKVIRITIVIVKVTFLMMQVNISIGTCDWRL